MDPFEKTPGPLSPASAPSPEEISGGVGGGEEPKAKQEETQSFSVSKDDWEAVQKRLEDAEKRRSDTQTWAHEERKARLAAEANVRAFEDSQRRQREEAQRAQSIPAPQVDWQKAQEDPEYLARAVDDVTRWRTSQALSYVQPWIERAQSFERDLGSVRNTSRTYLLDRAAEDWKRAGYSESTYREIRGDFQGLLDSNPQALETVQNGNGVSLLFHLAHQRGLPIQDREPDKPPITSSAAPPNGQPARIPADVANMARAVRRNLRLSEEIPTDELAEVAEQYYR